MALKPFRTSLRLSQYLAPRELTRANQKTISIMPNRRTHPVLKIETQGLWICDIYLCVIAFRLELVIAQKQLLVDKLGFLQRRAIQRLCDSVQLRIQRVKKNDAEIIQNARVELREGTAKGLAFAVGSPQVFADLGDAKQSFNLCHCRRYLVIKRNAPNRRAFYMRHIDRKFLQMVSVWQADGVNLCQIVIFRGHPEDGDSTGLFRGQSNRERLQQTKKRPAKQSGLLPCNDSRRSFPQALKVSQRVRSGAEDPGSAVPEYRLPLCAARRDNRSFLSLPATSHRRMAGVHKTA